MRTTRIAGLMLVGLSGAGMFVLGCSAKSACEEAPDLSGCTGSGNGGNGGTGNIGGMGGVSGGGNGGMGGGTPPGCVPSEADGSLAEDCGLFVNADASGGGDGTQGSPFQTIADAVAASNGGAIYVCTSSAGHNEAVTVDDNIDLYGGVDCSSWEFTGTQTSWTAPADMIPLTINGAVTNRIEDFAISAQDAVMPGGNSLAVLVASATVNVTNVALTAGDGALGGGGADGGAQDPQAEAGDGGAPAANSGTPGAASGGTNARCGLAGGDGGPGGLRDDPASSGDNGEPGDGGAGAAQGNGQVVMQALVCAAGQGEGSPGMSGGAGQNGDGASGLGTLTGTGFAGAAGGTGQPGEDGESGGGGGGSASTTTINGAGGGGGGAGGCGGAPGEGGQAGGSSIGLASLNATINLSGVTITVGVGADGGAGGIGQFGQEGGDGGTGGDNRGFGAIVDACDGGDGGNGGNGGNGGGGSGGHSAGVIYSGTAPTGVPVAQGDMSAGTGGPGGDNGLTQADAGADGQVGDALSIDG